MLSAALGLKPKDANALGKAQLSFRGPYYVVHPGTEVVDVGTQNFAQNTLGVSRQMSDLLRTKAGNYTSNRALPEDGREMSQFEASARISNAAGMTVTNLILYLEQEEKLLKQQVRRIIRPDYSKDLPGGDLVEKLHERLLAKGIPLEALYELDVDTLKVTRPVGAGSPAARENIYRQLQEMAPAYDEVGRRNLVRLRTASLLGSFVEAEQFVPAPTEGRIPEGTKMAMMENIAMKAGEVIEVIPDEFHIAHLTQHTEYMVQFIQQAEEGTLTLAQAVPLLFQLHEHSLQHLEFINGDPMAQAEASTFRQMLQQSGEILLNGMRQLEKENRENGGAAPEGEAGPQQPSVEDQKHMLELQRMMDKHELSMKNMWEQGQLKAQLAILDANTKAQMAQVKTIASLAPSSLQRQGK
jgi:hypothetical protein